jgi:acetoacetate decarboxylase
MKAEDVRRTAFCMPHHSPSYPRGPYRIVDREYLTITYRTDGEALRRIVPEPLEPVEPVVRIEFDKLPDSTGFGASHGAAQVIPVRLGAETGGYTRLMFLDAYPPIAGGRELLGLPQKLAGPSLRIESDTLLGTLDFGPVRVVTGSMGYKHRLVAATEARAMLDAPGFLLKIIPHVDGKPRICELVRHTKQDLVVKGAWSGPVSLDLHPHALAPLADLPILDIIGGTHVVVDYTVARGAVAHDYLA